MVVHGRSQGRDAAAGCREMQRLARNISVDVGRRRVDATTVIPVVMVAPVAIAAAAIAVFVSCSWARLVAVKGRR